MDNQKNNLQTFLKHLFIPSLLHQLFPIPLVKHQNISRLSTQLHVFFTNHHHTISTITLKLIKLTFYYRLIRSIFHNLQTIFTELKHTFRDEHSEDVPLLYSREVLLFLRYMEQKDTKYVNKIYVGNKVIMCLYRICQKMVNEGVALRNDEKEHEHDTSIERLLTTLTPLEASILVKIYFHKKNNIGQASWNTIVGLKRVKNTVQHTLYSLTTHNDNGIHNILLNGPSGTGKSLLLNTLSNHPSKITFLSVTPSILFTNPLFTIPTLFSLASKCQPCIILLEHMDGIFPERTLVPNIVSQFLSSWDQHLHSNIGIVSTCCHGNMIDKRILNRMVVLNLPLPHNKDRFQYIEELLQDYNCNKELVLQVLTHVSQGCSYEKIKRMVELCVNMPWKNVDRNGEKVLTIEDIKRVRYMVVSKEDRDMRERMMSKSDDRNNNPEFRIEGDFITWRNGDGSDGEDDEYEDEYDDERE